jgi:hypothetical protein
MFFLALLLQTASLLASIYFIIMLVRNERVYQFREKFIDEHFEDYWKLPPYKKMVREFWKPLKSYLRDL